MTVSVEPFECRLHPPLTTAQGTIESRRGLLFRVDEAVEGIGESAPLPPFTEPYEKSNEVLERAAAEYRRAGWPGAFRVVSETAAGTLRYPAARHAVSLAVLDWRGKTVGNPLHELLNGGTSDPVPVNATIGDGSPKQTVEDAQAAQDAGFPAVKIKVGARSVHEDVSRLRAVRKAIGPDTELRADANGAWNLGTAKSFLSAVSGLELSVLEQPLPAEQTEMHAKLRSDGPDIFLDESLANGELQSILETAPADGYVVKPMAVGGVDRANGFISRATHRGAGTIVSSIFESVVGRTGAIHLAAALDHRRPAGLATASRYKEDLGPDPAPVENGSIVPPTDPGLGIAEVRTNG